MKRILRIIGKIALRLSAFLLLAAMVITVYYGVKGWQMYQNAIKDTPITKIGSSIRGKEHFTHYRELPEIYINAVISAEDKRFFSHGHQCGDAVIRYVATLLNRGAIKNGGIAGRYGGEEFVVAFMNKSLQETHDIVKEIHSAIKSEPVVYEDKEVLVRASVGIASFPETCSNPSELLTRADWEMYHSKKNGRDQITIDSDQIKGEM